MCGRYALALRPSDIRQILENADMPVSDAPEDHGTDSPRQTYNFAPGYFGIVYRADTPDYGAGPRHNAAFSTETKETKERLGEGVQTTYKLQSMKWGLVPSWSKRSPDYASMLKTINCRSDSLQTPGGMWASMKSRKRCIVVAQGFFEWLKTGPKDKLPHYIKRKDGQVMCFAGLWDCVQFSETEPKVYTYTIITTDSNKQLSFLHDRMPVILEPGSESIKTWLDPSRHEWSRELQALLRPFDGDLEIYPVSKDVGKVGNNSPSFIRPLDSKENKSNIANFFTKKTQQHNLEAKPVEAGPGSQMQASSEDFNSPGQKRKHDDHIKDVLRSPDQPAAKKPAPERVKKSASNNTAKGAPETKGKESKKITGFFCRKF